MHDRFLKFIQLLNEEGVEYAVIGGFYQDLIKNKKAVGRSAVGRSKDLLDLENLPPPEE
jgi:hypothetical protein